MHVLCRPLIPDSLRVLSGAEPALIITLRGVLALPACGTAFPKPRNGGVVQAINI